MCCHKRITWATAVLAACVPACEAHIRAAEPTPAVALTSLWTLPHDLADRDLFHGQWGADRAPHPDDSYRLVAVKRHGVNPGVTVRDSQGRRWSVKQPLPDALGDEGPVEVTLSRVLSAVGYHQPPVYFLPRFSLTDDWGTRDTAGGRFRLTDTSLKEIGQWSWRRNPFVGTKPYQGLLAILLMLNSSDLKNANNSLYLFRAGDRVEHWYVVRDLGTALGETGRLAPRKNDAALYERSRFIVGVTNGFVDFAYRGRHQDLIRARLTPDDVGWGAELLSGLSDGQWRDAFRAGGYAPSAADRFIRKIRANMSQALAVARDGSMSHERR